MKQYTGRPALTKMNEELAARLVSKGLVSEDILQKAAAISAETGELLVEVLVNLDFLPKRVAYEEQADVFGVPFVDLEDYAYNPAVVALVDEKTARELVVFPLFCIGDALTIAMTDPGDITVIDRITNDLQKYTIEACLASQKDLHDIINRVYSKHEEFKDLLDQMDENSVSGTAALRSQESALQNSKSPVSRLVDMILSQAVRDRASDIHIDPGDGFLKVRFRIDGALYEIPPPPQYLHPFIISRIKVISSMNIAESRVPQDGHFQVAVDNRSIEARVSSMPTVNGENMSIRLFDARAMTIPIDNMGLPAGMLPKVDKLIRRPYGMIVVTGPTGSGKSTTLYAMLSKARSPERNIITIEDPVERRMDMVTQVQINEKASLSFASALRSVLRQDPDVIMVGEIRDHETAQLAVRAALTGHLLFSTIHTNDAPGAVTRLVNMNIEPFLVSSSMAGAMGQRLVRCICEECKTEYSVPDGLRSRLSAASVKLPPQLWYGKGCSRCRDTGYLGRIGVFELMVVTQSMADLISAEVASDVLRTQARKEGMTSMLEDALEKAGRGVTTLEEALRVSVLEDVADIAAPSLLKESERDTLSQTGEVSTVPESLSLDLDSYKAQMTNWLSRKK